MTLGVLRDKGQKTPSTPSGSLLIELNFLTCPGSQPSSPNYRDRKEGRGLQAGVTGAKAHVSPASKACWLVAEIDSRINAALACSSSLSPLSTSSRSWLCVQGRQVN